MEPFKVLLYTLRVDLSECHPNVEVSRIDSKDLVLLLDLVANCQPDLKLKRYLTRDLLKLIGPIVLLLYLIKRIRAQILYLPVPVNLFDFI